MPVHSYRPVGPLIARHYTTASPQGHLGPFAAPRPGWVSLNFLDSDTAVQPRDGNEGQGWSAPRIQCSIGLCSRLSMALLLGSSSLQFQSDPRPRAPFR